MKRKILLFLMAMLIASMALFTLTACDNTGIVYELSKDGTYYTVVGYKGNSKQVEIPSKHLGKSVRIILGDAFRSCTSFTSIEIPDSVDSIGTSAFRSCLSLTSITVDENNANYKDIDGNLYSKDGKTLIQYAIGKTATSFTIPNSVQSIGDGAFRGCTSLTSVEIPDSVQSIGTSTFESCSSLASVIIGNGVQSIGDCTFYNCKSLTRVVIGDSVQSIGQSAFENCYSLTSIVIPDSVDSIGQSAFENCSLLTSVVIGDSIQSIGYRIFFDCDSLTSVVIGNGVQSIVSYAFYDCSSLNKIYYKGSAKDWAEIDIHAESDNAAQITATRCYYIENEQDLPNDGGNYWHYVGGVPTVWAK